MFDEQRGHGAAAGTPAVSGEEGEGAQVGDLERAEQDHGVSRETGAHPTDGADEDARDGAPRVAALEQNQQRGDSGGERDRHARGVGAKQVFDAGQRAAE